MKNWEVKQIQAFLKQVLKTQKIKYAELANQLNVSEMTVKRMLSGSDLTISKINSICKVLNLSLLEVVNSSLCSQNEDFYFTEEQEAYLAENIHLYYFLNLLIKREGEELQELEGLNSTQIFRYLRALEQINLLELYPNNKFQLKCHWPITWLPDGPLQKSLMMTRHKEYIEYLTKNVRKDNIFITSGEGVMSKESFKQMQEEYGKLFEKYAAIRTRDAQTTLPKDLIEHIWLHGAGWFHRDLGELLMQKT